MTDEKSIAWCVSWCHGRQATVRWRKVGVGEFERHECVVTARVRGTVRTVARSTFAEAVTVLSGGEW